MSDQEKLAVFLRELAEMPLFLFRKTDNIEIIESADADLACSLPLIIDPIDIHDCDVDNNISLHYAANWGRIDIIEILLNAGIEIDSYNIMNCTPLYNALFLGKNLGAAEYLLQKGANPDFKTKFGTIRDLVAMYKEPVSDIKHEETLALLNRYPPRTSNN